MAATGLLLLVAGVLFLVTRGKEEAGTPEPARAVQPSPPVPKGSAKETADLQAPGAIVDNRPRGILEGVIVDDVTEERITRFVLRAIPSPRPAEPEAWLAPDVHTQNISGDGTWGVPFLPPGTHTLRFDAVGFAPKYFENVEIPSPIKHLEVRMSHGRWIHGVVQDASGAPIADFPVKLVPEYDINAGTTSEAFETKTDQEGSYDFSGLPAGTWHVELAGLTGVLKEVPASSSFSPAADEEIVWDVTLPRLTAIDMTIKIKAKRFVFARMQATLTNSWGANVVAPFRNEEARFDFVDPGTYQLAIGKLGAEPWLVEVVEVPESDVPLSWHKVVTPPEREIPKFNRPGRLKAPKRKG